MSLSVEGVWFRYHSTGPWVVHDAGLDLPAGAVVGLQGPSGSGKSTLGRIACGLLRPARGEVRADGAVVTGPNRRCQYLVQQPLSGMNPRWTIAQILAEAGAAVDAEADLVEPTWLDRYPHEISGGQLQRVNLARALRVQPAYLIADEITASLDAITQAQVWSTLLTRARALRIGVLAISHDAPLLEAVCDRVEVWP